MKQFGYIKHELSFAFDARTSRGAIKTHVAYLVHVSENGITGWGEASPLQGLSVDATPGFEMILDGILQKLNHGEQPGELNPAYVPSIYFAVETALRDLENGGKRIIYDSPFANGEPIEINGLVWMDENAANMLHQAMKKAAEGYSCIKFKTGALDFDEECRMLEKFRKAYSLMIIRLDANGAFSIGDAKEKLNTLKRFSIHSIEQPIAPGQHEFMHELTRTTSIPIALDEELIGIASIDEASALLKKIKPAYVIIKPTLIGGCAQADALIKAAGKSGAGWWATSALESNIGLNAIAQWCSQYHPGLPQGLGTGNLYTNNIPSPLLIQEGQLSASANKKWLMPVF